MPRFQDLLKDLFGWKPGRPDPTLSMDTWANELVGLGKHEVSLESMYYDKMMLPYTRESMYQLYDELDEMSEIAGVLNGYAQDANQKNTETDLSVWIKSDNETVRSELMYMLHDTLEVEEWVTALTRDLAKYGDEFPILNYNEREGIIGIKDWPQSIEIKRVENRDGILLGFLDDRQYKAIGSVTRDNMEQILMKPWDLVHFKTKVQNKIPGYLGRWIYGTSMLYGIRRSGRRMLLFSDLLFLYRLRNSFDRRIYYIDVGTEDLNQSVKILKKWRRSLEKDQYVNWDSNMFRATQNPWVLGESIFWPRRTGSTSAVETLAGNPNVADMADVDREQNSLFAGLNAPKEYFGFGNEGGLFERDKGLTLKDMRWGRAVSWLQRGVKHGIERMCSIHLRLKGIDTSEAGNMFSVEMVKPSTLELLQSLAATAQITEMADAYFTFGNNLGLNEIEWKKHTLKKFFSMTDSEISKFLPTVPEEAAVPEEGGGEIDLSGLEGPPEEPPLGPGGPGEPEEGPVEIPAGPEAPEAPETEAPPLTASFKREPLPGDKPGSMKRLVDDLNNGKDFKTVMEQLEGDDLILKAKFLTALEATSGTVVDRSGQCFSRLRKFDAVRGILEIVTVCHPFDEKFDQAIRFANWKKLIESNDLKNQKVNWELAFRSIPNLMEEIVDCHCGCPDFVSAQPIGLREMYRSDAGTCKHMRSALNLIFGK